MRSISYRFAPNDAVAAEREQMEPVSGVPMVRVLDADGKELFRGWSVRHECRQPYVMDDELRPSDVAHLVAVSGSADWGLERPLRIIEVTPPHRIEVIA